MTDEMLRNFLGGYLNQDWQSEHSSVGEAVDEFLSDSWTREDLRQLAEAIQAIANLDLDDAELEKHLFSQHGCYYMPSQDGLSVRDWLKSLRERFRDESTRRP